MSLTTIQVQSELKKKLDAMKLYPRETYNDVLERVLEDLAELNDITRQEIEKAAREIESGKYRSHAQVKAEMGF